METQFHPEILEIAEPQDSREEEAVRGEETAKVSYSCGRCPPGPEPTPY